MKAFEPDLGTKAGVKAEGARGTNEEASVERDGDEDAGAALEEASVISVLSDSREDSSPVSDVSRSLENSVGGRVLLGMTEIGAAAMVPSITPGSRQSTPSGRM
jgi:hypothetical protein